MDGLTRTLSGTWSLECRETVGGECVMQADLVHEFLARVLVAYVDAVAAVVFGVDLDNGEVQGVLTGFGGEVDGRSPGELSEDTFLLRPPVGGNLVVQGPECIQPLLRLLQILLRCLALLERLGVVHVLN